MIPRLEALERLATAVRRSPVTALIGPRQCGKTTLAKEYAAGRPSTYLDLESPDDAARLANPLLALGELRGLVVLDEIQRIPDLFAVLRVLADRPGEPARFLTLGSTSPELGKTASESLAGRVEFVELGGLQLTETGADDWRALWSRGGFPRSFLAASDADSYAWRSNHLSHRNIRRKKGG